MDITFDNYTKEEISEILNSIVAKCVYNLSNEIDNDLETFHLEFMKKNLDNYVYLDDILKQMLFNSIKSSLYWYYDNPNHIFKQKAELIYKLPIIQSVELQIRKLLYSDEIFENNDYYNIFINFYNMVQILSNYEIKKEESYRLSDNFDGEKDELSLMFNSIL